MGALVDTRVYKEVAIARPTIKQNPHLFVVTMKVYERVEDDQRGVRVVLQP
jgi:hypothetical protein